MSQRNSKSKLSFVNLALKLRLRHLKWLALALLFAAPKIGLAQGVGYEYAPEGVVPSISGAIRGTAEVLREGGKWVAAQATNAAAAPILVIIYPITLIITFIAGIILTIEGAILSWVIDPNSFPIADLPAVIQGWEIVRDLANMTFILALIWIAVATMLRIETYGVRQTLWRLIVAALLVNFSFIIAAGIIDVAEILTKQFLTPLGGGKGLVDSFMSVVDIVKAVLPSPLSVIWKSTAGLITNLFTTDTPNLWLIFNSVMGAIFVLILAFIMLAAIIFMVIRILYLWVLLIFAPFAWVSWIFPASRRWWSEWWSNFLRWTFFAPIFIFFMYLSLSILSGIRAPRGGGGLIKWPTVQNINSDANPEVFMMFFLSCGLLIAGLLTANKFGIAGAGMVMNMGKFLKGFGLGQMSRWAARGAKLPAPIQRWITGAGAAGAPAWQRAISGPIRAVQWAGRLGVLSPEVIRRTYAQRLARQETTSYGQAVGRLDSAVSAALSLKPTEMKAWYKNQRLMYEQMGRQRAVQDRMSEINKSGIKEEDQLVSMYQQATDPIEREALFRILASMNGINTLFLQLAPQGKWAEGEGAGGAVISADQLTPETLQAYIKKDFAPQIGEEFAAILAADISNMAKENGNFSFDGMAKWDAAKKKMVFSDTTTVLPSGLTEMQEKALSNIKKLESQQLTRLLHPESIFQLGRNAATGKYEYVGIHGTGNALVNKAIGAQEAAQFGRAQRRTMEAIVKGWTHLIAANPTDGPTILYKAAHRLKTGKDAPQGPSPAGFPPPGWDFDTWTP